jgi:hypothetical protein
VTALAGLDTGEPCQRQPTCDLLVLRITEAWRHSKLALKSEAVDYFQTQPAAQNWDSNPGLSGTGSSALVPALSRFSHQASFLLTQQKRVLSCAHSVLYHFCSGITDTNILWHTAKLRDTGNLVGQPVIQ